MTNSAQSGEKKRDTTAGLPQRTRHSWPTRAVAMTLSLVMAALTLPNLTTSAKADSYGFYYSSGNHNPYHAPRRHWRQYHDVPPGYYRRHARKHYNYQHHGRKHYGGHAYHRRKNNDGAIVAGAIIGLAVGAIIANEANKADRARSRAYVGSSPDYGARYANEVRPGTRHAAAPEPFTDDWYAYCASKYKTFEPETGTFQPYEGPRRLCR